MDFQYESVLTEKPQSFFGKPNKPIGGSGFKMKGSPFSGASDYESGSGGMMTESGQVVDTASGEGMSGYRLKLADLARRHQPKRKASELVDLAGDTIGKGIPRSIYDKKSKKRRTKDVMFPDIHFADGKTTASTSIGGFGFSLNNLKDEKEMTTTSGFHSNGSIPGEQMIVIPIDEAIAPGEYDIIITSKRPFLNGFEDETLKNMGIAIPGTPLARTAFNVFHQGSGREPIWPFANQMAGFSSPPRRGFSLAAFNYWVAKHQIYSDKATTRNADDVRRGEMMRHFDFIKEFVIHGIADSEMHATGQSSFGRNLDEGAGASSVSSMTDKKLNVIYEGKAQQKNIWGPITAGVTLWLVWKKVKRPDNYIISSNGVGSSVISSILPTVNITDPDTSSHPFQLVPFASAEHSEPPMSFLEYESDHVRSPDAYKRKYVGVCFYIGQMLKPQDTSIGHDGADRIRRSQIQEKAVYDCTTGSTDLIEILTMVRDGKPGRISRPESFPITRPEFLQLKPNLLKEIEMCDAKEQ